MTRPIRIAAQIPPAGTPSYSAWRDAVLRAEDIGADAIFGYDHFLVPAVTGRDENGRPITSRTRPCCRISRAGRRWPRGPRSPTVPSSDFWSAERGSAIPTCSPTWLAQSTTSAVVASSSGLGAGWYEPDYTEYSYDFGTVSSRHAVFIDALERIENRLTKLEPPPLRKIPILIGGGGEKKTIPAVARFADIWHSGGELEVFVRKNAILVEQIQRVGRDDDEIERAVSWSSADAADGFADAGATMFTVTVVADGGYDLAELKAALAWRDSRR